MEHVRLGRTGMQVSRICLGMMSYGSPAWRPWVLDEEGAEPFVQRALDLGITFFDTADMYSRGVSEEVTGKLLLRYADREDVVLATKVFFPMKDDAPNAGGLSRKHILAAIDASLRRLGVEYVDLYQIHRWDPQTPIEETMEALHDVVRAGKARYIGASSMYAWQFATANAVAERNGWTPFVSMQPHYNLLYREEEREMLPYCRANGIGVIPWSPLARGRLARSPDATTTRSQNDPFADHLYGERDREVVERVLAVAERNDATPAQVALAWLLSRPGVTAPIVGATEMAHLDQAVAAVDLVLSDDDVATLEEPYIPHPVLGHS